MRFFYFWFRRGGRRRMLLGLLAVLLLSVSAALILVRLRPLLINLASTRVSNTVNQIVSRAVSDSIESGELAYNALVSWETDDSGHITMVRSNMAACNHLQGKILDSILTQIDSVPVKDLSIPIGTLTGSALLAGRGPRLSVRMESVGSSTARFENEFECTGINQTKHRIILCIDVYVSILLPGFTTAICVSNSVTVAETVIVGDVPETYTYFHSGDPAEELAHDHVMNKTT